MAENRLSRLLKASPSLSSNIAANIAANVVIAVVFFVSVPLYLPLIGVEAYGLVGFFIASQSVLSVLDLGLSVMVTRELAVRIEHPEKASESRDLLRSAEFIYWGIAALTILAWTLSVPLLVRFVNPLGLTAETLYYSFILMGVTIGLQFPIGLYSAGLYGVQKQALLSGVSVLFSLLRNLGVVAALHYLSATPQTFFAWFAVCAILQVPILASCIWYILPRAPGLPKFSRTLIGQTWRFTAGIGFITLASVLLIQIDKFVLARMLPLDVFGYYALAAVVSGALQWLVQPLFKAYFPQISKLKGTADTEMLARVYHQGCQLMAIAVFPISAVCIFFSWELMLLWQQNEKTASNTYVLVSLLVAGSSLNALIYLPYALQLAFGWTRLQLTALALGVVISVPLTIAAASNYGAVGAASVWIVLNILFISMIIPVMHRRLLTGEKRKWFIEDVLSPAIAVSATIAVCRAIFIEGGSLPIIGMQLAAAFTACTAAAVAASSHARLWVRTRRLA